MAFKWKFWEKDPREDKRIYAIRGEKVPGVLTVDVATYDENGEVIPYPNEVVEVKVTSKLRPLVNRVLAEVETKDDMDILNLHIQKLLSK